MKFPSLRLWRRNKTPVVSEEMRENEYRLKAARSARRLRNFFTIISLREASTRLLRKLGPSERTVLIGFSLLMVFSTVVDFIRPLIQNENYFIDDAAEQLLVPKVDFYEPILRNDFQRDTFEFNEGYTPGGDIAGQSASPKFSATIQKSPGEGISVYDAVTNIGITIKPLFELGEPRKDTNRVVYPLFDGTGGTKVISLGTAGYKEDIIIEDFVKNELDYSYEILTPDGVEARLEDDGSLGFYGVSPTLLGDVSAASEEDQQLLDQARENGEKNRLLFSSPAPVVLEDDRRRSEANAWYSLEEGILTVHTDSLDQANYPISIDPSIYVETARKLMRGNNETNIDFDVDNELIKKGFTTGARFDTWNNTMDLNDGRWNHGTAVAGGYIYAVGGEKTNTTTTTFTTSGSDTFVVPAGVNEITVKAWGGGGGGGGAGVDASDGDGGTGGGGGFAQATLSVTPAESLDIFVGGGGTGGAFSTGTAGDFSGDGGGGGGRSYIERTGTPLIIAGGGGGGGGGDNSSAIDGGAGGAGGGSQGQDGSASSSAPGGNAGGTSCTGSLCDGGNGSENDGATGASESGGAGADGRTSNGADGSANNGGTPNGGDGGTGDEADAGFGAGGGGGDGYFGGGGGSSSIASNAGGGGGGGGSSYVTGTSTTLTAGSGTVPGNDGDGDRGGAGDGGTGGVAAQGTGGTGDDGIVVITYSDATASITQAQTPVTAQCTDTDNDCTATATITSATSGNHIIAVCTGEGATGWTNVLMTGYTSAATETTNANMGQEVFYKVALGGETSVSCELNGNGSGIKGYLSVYEYSGLAGSPVDVSASNTGSSTSPSTGTTATTAQPDSLLLAAISSDEQSITQSGWTNSFSEDTDHSQTDPEGSALATATRVVTSTGAYSTAATASATSDWIGQIIAFRADTLGTGSEVRSDIYWAELSTSDNSIQSANPGTGACTDWCTNSVYNLPEERAGASVVTYNGFLYVIGGVDNSGNRENTVFIAKLGANGEPALWHPTDSDQANWDYWYSSSNTLTNATSYGAAVAYNGRMYFLGGQTGASTGGVTAVYSANLDPTGDIDAWSTTGMTVLPSVRHMHTVHTYNDYIYLVGGNSNGTLQNTVHYTKLDADGDMNAWTSTNTFDTARSTWGGNYSVIWGGYLYLAGGCTTVDAGGECTNIALDIQLASINADGSLDVFNTISGVTNQRIGYGFVAWDNAIYRIGGCSSQDASSAECLSVINDEDYAVINTDGDASTVSISQPDGSGDCTGSTPFNCDLPPAGDDAGEAGHMLSSVAVVNGFLYVIGGCIDYDCNGTNPSGDDADATGNVAYAAINSDGTLGKPSTCVDQYYGAWCVDSTNRVNGTDGIATAGVTVFNGTIYLVGGVDDSNDIDGIYRNEVNPDGSLNGAWTFQNWSAVGIGAAEEIYYTYAYSRANPSSAGTNPGNLYIMGGCGDFSGSGVGCSNSDYRGEVYKCNIGTSGAVASCTTTGQLQIDIDSGTGGDQGIGAHAGTVYANRIYLIAGLDSVITDRDQVITAQFDDSNNIVAVSGSEWLEETNQLQQPRRRGSGFGYNGYVYGVGGFEDGGGTIIDDIEFAQVDVSDGSVGTFSTSTVTINQRWGLAMAVSNSFAYVVGGCDSGASPGSCNSFEPSVQTFQLYNNNSGTADSFSASGNQFGTDRYGGSATIYNGYIYLAGGCTDEDIACNTVTRDVQFASLDALGEIGTWSSTAADLPAGRAWGQLEEAGGSLYWIGGEDAAGDEKSDVYHSTPLTSAGSATDVFRTTTYEIQSGEFTGTTYTLALNNNLSPDYFAMITGVDDGTSNNTPSESSVRVSQDFHENFSSSTANANEIQLTRGGSGDDWVGSVTIVECLLDCDANGFRLKEVRHVSLAAGTSNALQTVTDTLSEDHTSNTVPFGARYGGGMSTTNATTADYSVHLGVRIYKSSTNQITIERYGAASSTPAAADVEVYIVEWGSDWTVQEANFVDWDAGGGGADAAGEYTTQTISSVTVDDTWIWKTPGTSTDDGLGDGAFGKVITLGDGTSPVPATTTTTIAIGSEQSATDTRRDTVYAMTHDNLAVDYVKVADNSSGVSESTTIASATVAETFDNSASDVQYTEGHRVPFVLGTESGTGTAYARAGAWYPRITADTTLEYYKTYSGNAHAAWAIVSDFANVDFTPGAGDVTSWGYASNGLPADRTQFGAASWNDRLYVVGGLDDSAGEVNTVYYSPDLSSGGDITSAWTSDADVPDVARSGNTVVAYANNLYTFGGHDGTNYLLDSQFTQINTDGTVDAWTFTTPLPDVIRQGDGFAANGYMYVVGGRSADTTCDSNMYVAPISANTTIVTGNNPTGVGEWYETNSRYTGERYGAAAVQSEGRLYVLGGGCPQVADDFDPAIDTAVWDSTTGMTATSSNCGILNTSNALASTGGGSAVAETNDFDVSSGGTINFYAYIPQTDPSNCDPPEAGEDLDLEYSTAGTGGPWTNIATYDESAYDPTQYISVSIPAGAQTSSTRFRWSISNADGTDDEWAIDDVIISSSDLFSLNDANRTVQATLLTQPQVAKYSRLIDTDTDVFPNSFLVNGIDNSIGARWQVRYRSMHDNTDAEVNPNEDCGTSATMPVMSSFGAETNVGDVTLGDVNTYTPLNDSSSDINCARFFYFFIEISAEQTFGYPEDVNRGPTLTDLSLFFTSDPSKRLRHGKTFTGGLEQPLDTPCRQSVDADCPLP